MNALNSIILEGNVTTDSQLKEPCTGFNVCSFSIAVNRKFKTQDNTEQEEVSFFDIECYGKMAEMADKHCKKGQGVRIVGRLKQSRWTDADGKNHSKVFVIAEHIEYKFSKKAAEPTEENHHHEEKTA